MASTARIRLDAQLGKAAPEKNPKGANSSSALPGGWWLWCLSGLALGIGIWLGGRAYLKHQLAVQLSEVRSSYEAKQIIDSLLRIDGDAPSEVARALFHPEFPVANAAYRALTEQLEAWDQLGSDEQLRRLSLLATALDHTIDHLSEDHQMLICSLGSRIYTETFRNPSQGAADVLDTCKRIVSRTNKPVSSGIFSEPLTQVAAEDSSSRSSTLATAVTSAVPNPYRTVSNPVPPPLAPVSDSNSAQFTDSSESLAPIENRSARSSLSDSEDAEPSAPVVVSTRSPLANPIGRATVHLTASSPDSLAVSDQPLTPITLSDDPPSASSSGQVASIASGQRASLRTSISDQDASATDRVPAMTIQDAQTLSGIDQLPIEKLVRLLASVQPRIADAAAQSLLRKGMPEDKLQLAQQLATGEESDRLQLIEHLAVKTDLDPRPWLAWMAEVGETSVRRRAVTLMAGMVNEDVRRQMRLQLNRERDEEVIATIRKILLDPSTSNRSQ